MPETINSHIPLIEGTREDPIWSQTQPHGWRVKSGPQFRRHGGTERRDSCRSPIPSLTRSAASSLVLEIILSISMEELTGGGLPSVPVPSSRKSSSCSFKSLLYRSLSSLVCLQNVSHKKLHSELPSDCAHKNFNKKDLLGRWIWGWKVECNSWALEREPVVILVTRQRGDILIVRLKVPGSVVVGNHSSRSGLDRFDG